MAIMQDEDARFEHLERKIGAFVLVALLGIALVFAAIALKQGLFTPRTSVRFVADSGQDIAAGMAVKMSGFHIGKVEELTLTEQAKVQVTLAINDEYMKWLHGDARARLLKEGLIGETIIDISPGSESAPPLAKSDTLVFERGAGLEEVVNQLYAQVVPILHDVKRLTHDFQDPQGDFHQILRRTNVILASLPETQRRLDSVLASAARNLESLEKLTANDLPVMVRRGRETIEGSKKIVDSVSRTWPISRNIEPARAELLRPDSYDATGGAGAGK